MTHELDGSLAKIRRGKEHLEYLDHEIRAAIDHNVCGVTTEDDPQTGERIVRVKAPETILRYWGVITGDVVHCLRSALEHTAWQLANLNHAVTTQTGFPVFKTKAEYDEPRRGAARQLKGMPADAVTLIERMQPYHAAQGFASHPLWVLHDLWNRDKHRLINLAILDMTERTMNCGPPGTRISIEHMTIRHGGVLKDGAELTRYKIGTDTPHAQVNEHYTFTIAFEKSGPGQGKPLIPSLEGFLDIVYGMVRSFERFFTPPSATT